MHQVTLEEARDRLAQLREEAGNGEEAIIKNNGYAVKLTPLPSEKPRPHLGSAKADLVYMAPDFDAPLGDFKDYM